MYSEILNKRLKFVVMCSGFMFLIFPRVDMYPPYNEKCSVTKKFEASILLLQTIGTAPSCTAMHKLKQ